MNYAELWFQALASDFGIVVETNDRNGLRQALYRARVETKNPALDNLSLILSPTDEAQVWIMKKPK